MKQQNSSVSSPTNEIFIVHGHDEEMKQTVARTLEALKLQPIILHEQSNQGATIIEKFEKNANVQFAIILLSPDDMAYKKTESSEKAKPRARQNVIFEFGYFIGKLSRAQVFVLKQDDKKDKLELPTDILGITYTPYDSGDSWKLKLVQALKATGYSVDANNLPT
ncbi:MAG: nucleotide-binding protein [Prochloron sp. SP5CPC1]|nr:nucleotide-binding protein [Candidatus Paraprochloron terpiosi SP5CPC1]